jgi:hypothetical protein
MQPLDMRGALSFMSEFSIVAGRRVNLPIFWQLV